MKIIVFGSTGGIGRQVVTQALDAGHQVTAVARRPEVMTIQHERLQVVRGDVLEPASFQQALTGQDVVVSALGPASGAGHARCVPVQVRRPPGVPGAGTGSCTGRHKSRSPPVVLRASPAR